MRTAVPLAKITAKLALRPKDITYEDHETHENESGIDLAPFFVIFVSFVVAFLPEPSVMEPSSGVVALYTEWPQIAKGAHSAHASGKATTKGTKVTK